MDFELSFSVKVCKVKNNNTFLTLDFLVANQNKRVENSMMHLAHQNKNTQFRRKNLSSKNVSLFTFLKRGPIALSAVTTSQDKT